MLGLLSVTLESFHLSRLSIFFNDENILLRLMGLRGRIGEGKSKSFRRDKALTTIPEGNCHWFALEKPILLVISNCLAQLDLTKGLHELLSGPVGWFNIRKEGKSKKDTFTPSSRMMYLINCLIKYSFLSLARVLAGSFCFLSLVAHVITEHFLGVLCRPPMNDSECRIIFPPLKMKIEMFCRLPFTASTVFLVAIAYIWFKRGLCWAMRNCSLAPT